MLAACNQREPAHGGKRLSQWFAEAVEGTANPQDVQEAFVTMEGEAVPFLVRQIRAARQVLALPLTNAASPWLVNPAGQTLQTLGLRTIAPGPETQRRTAYELTPAEPAYRAAVSRFTAMKASRARSRSAVVWAADICVRMRAWPCGTTG
jgi:hypothetical protein